MKIDKSSRPKTLAERKNSAEETRPQLQLLEASVAQTPWQRRAQGLRNHPLVVIMETIGLTGLIFAAGIFFYELRERQDERVARSWQLLTAPAPGNSGKREAIEYLNSQYGCLPEWLANLPPKNVAWCWKQRTTLRGIDLSQKTNRDRVYLVGAKLDNADMKASNFSGAELSQVNLKGAKLSESDFRRGNISNADLSQTFLTRADFSRAALYDTDLNGARLNGARFIETKMSGANLSRALLFNAKFANAILTEVDLSYANLTGADFSNATLSYANLVGVNLSSANLGGIRHYEAIFTGAWAWEYAPPVALPYVRRHEVLRRKVDEAWNDFVDRIMRERPELGWTSDLKDKSPD
ncbi:pentapeptide repeat-containing protein [uncultured Roseibium sp.]|uniref:pentapeptide repeat-containing protein n=1 Tax=uncultured Roseibium sp. TaxID=1936171 RepID=UPI0026152155|nr:pentapeptide repeat-containing protein [uncultured Roseibium sp.]